MKLHTSVHPVTRRLQFTIKSRKPLVYRLHHSVQTSILCPVCCPINLLLQTRNLEISQNLFDVLIALALRTPKYLVEAILDCFYHSMG
ncbi:hypothetical protein HMPREF1544_01129 [Mucor circinelloides 1006PhL]|uniref:Uncharacterized protein n=1 Tax=Mucor circinelloides f. circinelloides (strain 1006PhL) TaxID=1220926 RepID=S2KI22_MUCC1|nr:hypothetical protein HMPREF1544_01129 [Mucor circinelloides 1006PhL]